MQSKIPKLKVIIADNSDYSRLVLSSMVQAQPDLELLDTTADGANLMEALRLHRPDVVLADINIQRQAFLLRNVFQEAGVPVLMIMNQEELAAGVPVNEEFGVYDYILKPAHKLRPKLREIQSEILDKIRAVRKPVPLSGFLLKNPTVFPEKSKSLVKPVKGIVVIGASTGGTQAIEKIVAELDEKTASCILIAVHLPAGFTHSFAARLQTFTQLKVVEGSLGTKVENGKIIVAPGGKNMVVLPEIGKQLSFKIGFSPENTNLFDLPSVNILMKSVAKLPVPKQLGILLTGMGKDGTEGLQAIQKNGGTTLAQDQASSVIFGMAKSAIEKGYVNYVHPLVRIPAFINKFMAGLPAAEEALQNGI